MLPGTYQYQWTGGEKVDGRCAVIVNYEGLTTGGGIAGDITFLPYGEEFTFAFYAYHDRVAFTSAFWGGTPQEVWALDDCRGTLVRIGE